MGRKRDVTEWQKGAIVFGREHGHKVAEIAAFVGVTASTVSTVHKQWRLSGTNSSRRCNAGRKTILTPRDRRHVRRLATANRFQTRDQLLAQVNARPGPSISERTLRRELHRMELYSRIPRRRPRLTEAQKRRRLQWATAHRHWTVDDWRRVIWSDESRFCLYANDARSRVTRRPGEAYHPDCVQRSVQQGGGSVMFWGCISSHGVGPLVQVNTRMKAVDYLPILADHVAPYVDFLRAEGLVTEPVFQDDNCTVHRARCVQDWFAEHEVDIPHLTWPANSPDLNVIEKIWDALEFAIKRSAARPQSLTELTARVMDEWAKITAAVIQPHVASMPRKIRAVIRARGDVTKY